LLNHTKRGLHLYFIFSQLQTSVARYFHVGGHTIAEVPDAGMYNWESMCDVTESNVEKLAGDI
jgi:hypothetical protein